MPNVTLSVLCPACGTRNPSGFSLGARCMSCGKPLPTIVPRPLVYAARTLFLPLLCLLSITVVLYAAPMLRSYRELINSTALHSHPR